MITISSNTLILNEINHVDGLIKNLLDAQVDEIIFLDGGSIDGTYEKLLEYEKKYEFLKALRWKQPTNSEYRSGFREIDRRNFMKNVSTGDYILYIDADERVSTDFKEKITNTKKYDVYVTNIQHFWGEKIRVNVKNDKVWSPQYQFRIIKNHNSMKFKSKDLNGLHNFLSKKNFKILGGFNSSSKIKKVICKVNNLFIGLKIKKIDEIKIYHLHYLDLNNARKKNDLRSNDLDYGKLFLVEEEDEGLMYDYLKNHTICCIKNYQSYKEIKKYI